MQPIRILHLADTHIGVENYGRLDTSTGLHTRLQDFVRCLAFAVDTALEQQVDAVLFAGDAYKQAAPNPTHEGQFAEQMTRLADAGIPVVMITGNHDIPAAFGRASALAIFRTLGGADRFTVVERPELVRLDTRSGPLQVACFPWPTRHALLTKDEYKNLSDDEITRTIEQKCETILAKFARDLDPDAPAVLLAHLAVADAVYSGSERSTMIGQDPVILQGVLKNPTFDYVALGHIHKHQDLHGRAQPPVVYSGSLERIDFGEAGEDKGFCLVSLEKGSTAYEFVQTPARRFVKIALDVRGREFPTEALLQRLQAYDVADAVVRVSYTLDDDQKSLVDVRKIYAALDEAFLIAGVTQETTQEQTRRPKLPEGLTIADTLAKYLEFRPELASLKAELQTYAGRLIQELERSE